MVYTLYMTSQNTYTLYMTCLYQRYDIQSKKIEHIYVISIRYTLIKILIPCMYDSVPSISYSYFLFTKTGRTLLLMPQVCRWACCACLVSSVISWMPKPAAAHARTRSANVCPRGPDSDSASGKGTCETYLVVCFIRRVKEVQLSGAHERASACNDVPL